ncbi:hypothetical protein AMTRI_Chr12g236210 [Amborella trichopoda]|uniref:B-cell receptor-associated protein 31 isoform X2 n=1 Tax=Amborella trichopoda TaxID=13333 RepID=UPI0005D3377A|nr:B-cell receptor-associated protein 31 isoform X2 [Amborella trichopoda]|eukprot:XP_011624428.1 B-cell receptor-associated protein 31 isoform X2 [Amborella trichopoda]
MIQLLFALLFGEGLLILLLLVRTPLRKLVLLGLDRVKRGRGPAVVKTLATTVFVVLVSSVNSVMKIQRRASAVGSITPTDQVLMSKHMLEASMMGYALFLTLMIDRMHHHMTELRILRKQIRSSGEGKSAGGSGDNSNSNRRALEEDIAALQEKVKELQLESEAKDREAKTAETNAMALRKQSEGFLLEYDRLLEDNQNLRSQLQSVDRRLSHSDSKKNM